MGGSQETEIDGHQLSGWWKRAGAWILDGLILGALSLVVFIILGLLLLASENAALIVLYFVLVLVLSIVFSALYYGWTMARTGERNGQSPGKQIIGIAVYRQDQQEVDFWYAVKRQVLIIGIVIQIASFFTGGIAYFLNYLWPLWDDKRQAFHDKMVGSRVIIADNLANSSALPPEMESSPSEISE